MRLFPAQPPPNRLQISARSCEFHTSTDTSERRSRQISLGCAPRKLRGQLHVDHQCFTFMISQQTVQDFLGRFSLAFEVAVVRLTGLVCCSPAREISDA